MSQTITRPTIETEVQADLQAAKPGRVVLYNCDCHSFEEVEAQLILATACTRAQAEQHAMTVHTQGRAVVFQAARADCEKVAAVLRRVGLQVEVDWD